MALKKLTFQPQAPGILIGLSSSGKEVVVFEAKGKDQRIECNLRKTLQSKEEIVDVHLHQGYLYAMYSSSLGIFKLEQDKTMLNTL